MPIKLTPDDIFRDIANIEGSMSPRFTKYINNFSRYTNNGRRRETIDDPYGLPITPYYTPTVGEAQTSIVPVFNYAKSAVDTLVSKISQTKVRPFFNAVNGSFKTRKVVRNAQLYFDELYVSQEVYRKAVEALRDALIFDTGWLWINDETGKVLRVRPWEVFYDRAEYQYGELTRIFLKFNNYPLTLISPDKYKAIPEAGQLTDSHDLNAKVRYYIYYDLKNKMKYEYANGRLIKQSKTTFSVSPLIPLFYSSPIKGGYGNSLLDDVLLLQAAVDMAAHRIHTAFSLTQANKTFVPKGADIKSSLAGNNNIADIIEYVPGPGTTGSPIVTVTPAPISPEYLNYLQFLRGEIYGNTGVSMLSAQAKKPSGLNSGVALDTLEDVESERHNYLLLSYVTFLMKVAQTCIDVYPQDEDILPRKVGTAKMKWGDVARERDNMSIQFSPASALSKDPKVKMEQIEKMIAMKMIPADRAAEMMEIPDLEREFSIETASLDVCERIIERAVEEEKYDFYETVNIQQLFTLTNFYINRFDANDESPKVMDRLVTLYNIIKGLMNTVNAAVVESAQSTISGDILPPAAPGPTNNLPLAPGQ